MKQSLAFFGTTEEEVNTNKFRIFVGVSLGNKYITTELARKYLGYALDHTKENVAILIADEIDVVNWEVFRGYSKEEARKKVKNKSDQLKRLFQRAVRQVAHERGFDVSPQIHIIRWEDITTGRFNALKEILTEEFNTNDKFKKKVLSFVDKYSKLRNKTLSESEKIIEDLGSAMKQDHMHKSVEMIMFRFIRKTLNRISFD